MQRLGIKALAEDAPTATNNGNIESIQPLYYLNTHDDDDDDANMNPPTGSVYNGQGASAISQSDRAISESSFGKFTCNYCFASTAAAFFFFSFFGLFQYSFKTCWKTIRV